ncbi:unnamed protein product [Onchocerca flexuosa]|uniref:Uncharacterized protein n=1 Tax=Onchocerca flexuosa TaxID=387005 RepID=A0A183HBU1_9BILA|nr:unnamed protein product [Onchocerca flexuosa]
MVKKQITKKIGNNMNSGYSLVCYLCDGVGESNCFGATCIGTACIKRAGLIHGFLRVQKMCQQTSEPLLEYCETNVLWKGGTAILLKMPLSLLLPLISIIKGIGVTTTSPKTPLSSSSSINFPVFISDTWMIISNIPCN